jgi:hypothetical protein
MEHQTYVRFFSVSFTLYLRNGWNINLGAIENCIFGIILSIERNIRRILRTVCASGRLFHRERESSPLLLISKYLSPVFFLSQCKSCLYIIAFKL